MYECFGILFASVTVKWFIFISSFFFFTLLNSMYTCKCRKFTSSSFRSFVYLKKGKNKKNVGFISYYYIYQLSHALNIRQRKGNERKIKLIQMHVYVFVSVFHFCLFVWSEILLRKFQFQKRPQMTKMSVDYVFPVATTKINTLQVQCNLNFFFVTKIK